eukprot:jgi/Astpho2/8794/fgenesh1_pm.00128_%23_17_t
MTDSLYTAKAAVEQGLISQDDYSAVKAAFLRAQQIKAGLDSGFLKPEDYQEVKRAFLQSLESLSLGSPVVQPGEAGQGIAVQQGANGMPQSAQMPAAASRTGMGSSQAAPQQQAPGGGPADVSMSGITVSEDAVNLYYFMKAKSNYRWALWRINDAGNEVIIAGVGDKDSPLSEFIDCLPSNDCRYGVYDHQFTNSEGFIFNKLVFVNWAPDTARIKSKMMYASTKEYFKGYLDGLSIELQASEPDELTEQDIADAVRSVITRS